QDHAAFRRILDAGELRDAAQVTGHARTPSWPSSAPSRLGTQIDHVLVSKEFSAQETRFLKLADTDHRALLVDLTLHQD
ncbi:endonuclease/exonuclease/phosphatase family protein, partial [Streptomyces sp. SID14478]|nr:endonuclease/exonuclease/phosphatase family protein [Streptomyces sp. SID14478]